MVSFAVQKLLSLIRLSFFFFAFISFALGDWSKHILLWFTSKKVLPAFSSRNFIVSSFIFRSLNHFELIFVCSVRECSNFILSHVPVQFSQHHLLKRLSFLHYICLPPLSKISWPYVCGFISGLVCLLRWYSSEVIHIFRAVDDSYISQGPVRTQKPYWVFEQRKFKVKNC